MSRGNVQVLGVMNGDPFDPKTWSGSSYYFFHALKSHGALYEAISAEPSSAVKAAYKALSFTPHIDRWRFKYNLNTGYYKSLTSAALKKLSGIPDDKYNVILQVGAWYDLTGRKDKCTVSYHDGNLQTLLNSPFGYPQIPSRYIRKALEHERALYGRLDRIYTMSRWLAESFVRDFGVDPMKVVPVGAGINLPYVSEPQSADCRENKILFVGAAFERKGGQYLLEAFAEVKREVKDATLTIIGPTLAGLPDGVQCLNFAPKNTQTGLDLLLNQYASSSVFVMPSLYEPFGIVFLEAMAHRLPCIGSNICAMPEIIDDGITGFVVPPRNSRALANSIIELLKNPGARKVMGENGYAKYRREYTWDVVVEKIISNISSSCS